MGYFSENLIAWYRLSARNLPWRHTHNPYLIWLSEIILQQTRVDQGMDYYLRFAENYPTVQHLAHAPADEVLRLWQGLGYYSRARNLHYTAKYVSDELNGVFPDNFADLCKLKGVGEYTAAAIASFAYNERVPVVDGNVYRVLARYLNLENDISASGSKKVFFEASGQLMADANPSEYNQAVMELGALVCTPRQPRCAACAVAEACVGRKLNLQHERPVKTKKTKTKDLWPLYAVLHKEGKIALRKRGEGDIWQGLYDFFGVFPESEPANLTEALCTALNLQGMAPGIPIKAPKHLLSHRTLRAAFVPVNVSSVNADELTKFMQSNGLEFYSTEEVEQLPKPVLIKNFCDTFEA